MIDVANLSLIYLQTYLMANREDDVGKKVIQPNQVWQFWTAWNLSYGFGGKKARKQQGSRASNGKKKQKDLGMN